MKKILFCCVLLCVTFIIVSFKANPKKKELISSKYNCMPIALASTSAISNGDWNNTATWSTNQIPTALDDVTIPTGIRVTLSGNMAARSVMIDGTLSPFSLTTDFELTTKGIMVHDGGLFQIGSAASKYLGKGLITLTGSDPTEILMGSSPIMGSKLIGVMSNGRLELHGKDKKSWTQLNVTAQAGATSITLKETIDWEVGDEIVIASTDFDPHQAEKRKITAINGLVLTLDAPLVYMHFGVEQIYNNGTKNLVLDERAEVGLLTRNLKIQGDASSETNGYGGHIMSMSGSTSKATNIELYRMGQKSQVGKYPWHWHKLGDANGQYIKNAGIHTSYNRVITVHGTNNTVVEGNVGFDFVGHGFFLEDGNETGNLFKNNLGVLCKRPKAGEETTPHDIGIGADRGASPEAFPATFWITNPNNDFIGNVSAGSDGSGFWHLILSEVLDNIVTSYKPGIQPMGVFDDNKSHSSLFSWGIDGGIDKVTEEIVTGHYRPQNPDGSQFIPNINRFVGYKSVDRNVWIRANKMNFYDCAFGDNGRADFFSYNQTLFNSLIVGKSANIGNPKSASEIEAGRTLPFPDRPLTQFANAFRGHSIYDGPSGIVNTHLDGFDLNGAKAYCFQTNGASRKSTNHFARGITFGPGVQDAAKFEFGNNSWFSYMFLSGIIDEDGSLTGYPGARITPIISTNPNSKNLYEKGVNTQMTDVIEKPEWGAWITKTKTYNYFKDIDFTNKETNAFTPRYSITEYPDKSTHAVFDVQTQQLYFDTPVITNDLGYNYYFQYHKLPNFMVASIDGATNNSESAIVGYLNLPSTAYAGNAVKVNNMSELKSSPNQAYFIKDNTFYFKHITNQTNSEFFQRQFGREYKYQSNGTFICVSGNCPESSWGQIVNKVTLIDYGAGNDSRDNAVTTDGITVPTFTYANSKIDFTVGNNGNGIDGYTDYEIVLPVRQVWEYFNTMSIDYTGPKVEVIVMSKNGNSFSTGTYTSNDMQNIRIGQDNQFDKFTNVKKLILRFHESNIGNINTASSANVQINSIKLGIDIPTAYSVSSTIVEQDSDGDGVLDALEINKCRDTNSASDFALEFNSDSTIFDGNSQANITNFQEIGGVIKGTTSTGDSQIIKKNFLNMSGSQISTITIRIKVNTTTTNRVQLFWENENGGIGSTRTIFKDYIANGTWQEITLDLSTNPEWQGKTISGLRIDPTNKSGINFEIDWIRANNAVDASQNCIPTIDDDGDGLYNKEEENLCRNANSASDFALEFNSDNDIFDGNTQLNITSFQEIGGVLKGTSTTADSQIIQKNFLNMSGSQISTISIRIKANIAITRVQLFWENENGSISSTRTVFQDYTGNGAWQELSFDMSTNVEWQGKTIKGIRIDPTNNTNVAFEIDWIRAQGAIDPSLPCSLSTNYFDKKNPTGISIFPNPITNGELVYFKGIEIDKKVQIVVYDMNGKLINSHREGNTLKIINASSGIYFVKFFFIDKNQVITKKLIIK